MMSRFWLKIVWLATASFAINDVYQDQEGVYWVFSSMSNESQYSACGRHGLAPLQLGLDEAFDWSSQKMVDVLDGIQCSWSNLKNSSLVNGCCASGLWYNPVSSRCETHSFGTSLEAVGWSNGLLPVYTCQTPSSKVPVALNLNSVDFSKGVLTVTAGALSSSESNLQVTIGSQRCSNVNMCSASVCSSCPCSKDSVCLGSVSSQHCFMFCSGPGDPACPCSTTCSKVYDRSTSVTSSSYVCTPTKFYSGADFCESFIQNKEIQCEFPQLENTFLSTGVEAAANLSIVATSFLGDGNISWVGSAYRSLVQLQPVGWCTADSDCFDRILCTSDSCNNITGKCEYKQLNGCTDMSQQVYERQAPYHYLAFTTMSEDESVASGWEELEFSRSKWTVEIPLPFSFVYFGNIVSVVVVHKDGVLILPPVPDCIGPIGTILCPALSTQSNVIGAWGKDWRSYGSTEVKVKTRLSSSQLTGTFVTVSFQVGQNSFSSSIYSDGSISIDYFSVVSGISSGDFFGLWASRQTSTALSMKDNVYLRYHSENISEHVVTNNSRISFCPQNSMACVQNSCVAPLSTLRVFWTQSSCLARDVTLSYDCVFGGGLAVSPADSTTLGVITCTVPIMNLTDGQTVSLDIVPQSPKTSNYSAVYYRSGSHSVFGVTRGQQSEITRHQLMVRYQSSGSCGCSALLELGADLQCDAGMVCGGVNTTLDCAGTSFGSAYIDSCGRCVGGYSQKSPCQADKIASTNSGSNVGVFAETMFLITFVCCMSFCLSSVSYVVRGALVRRGFLHDTRDFELIGGDFQDVQPQARAAGLTAFECEALGECDYTLNLIPTDSTRPTESPECSICLTSFAIGDKCRLMPDPCGHIFHLQCIDEWFQRSPSCPLCKRSIRSILEGDIQDDAHNDHSVSVSSSSTGDAAGGERSGREEAGVVFSRNNFQAAPASDRFMVPELEESANIS